MRDRAATAYLFKVLAAEKAAVCSSPPNKQLKRNLAMLLKSSKGIPMTAGNRNYKDPKSTRQNWCMPNRLHSNEWL
ncbi:hypothetical protein OH492_15105 [Vibrio chagasii]|nr:hypothetical protein [Vibrio chagasii]